MGKTVTRADLVDAVFRKVGFSRAETAELMEAVFEEISGALERGEKVKLPSFATFRVRAKNERPGRNPRTGKCQCISARNVMSFKASNLMKARIQASFAYPKANMAVAGALDDPASYDRSPATRK